MPPTSTRIRLQPANNSRIPFWGQMAIGLFWIFYVGSRLVGNSSSTDGHFLDYVFLVFSLVYIGYVLVNNAPIFGTQTYLEFTPAYLVHKGGLFKPKQAFPADDITALELAARQLRVRLKDGENYMLSLREVRGTRRRRILREQVQRFAAAHQIALRDAQEQ